MAIIVMNLLTGLAISSIEELNENGAKIQAFQRVENVIAGTRLSSNTGFGKFEKQNFRYLNVNVPNSHTTNNCLDMITALKTNNL